MLRASFYRDSRTVNNADFVPLLKIWPSTCLVTPNPSPDATLGDHLRPVA